MAVDYINPKSIIYSFGIGEDLTFELELINKFNVNVFSFDPTPKSLAWAKSQNLPDKIIINEYGIGKADGLISFYPPENNDFISHSTIKRSSGQTEFVQAPVKRLDTIMKELSHNRIDLLKMDIEGSEYDVINDLERINIRPIQILVEFHHGFPEIGVPRTKQAIRQLTRMGYALFAYSIKLEEFSFIHLPTVKNYETRRD
ncbi:MAG: FkbM family methyltransferase [Chloroflexi bacterium]|nr:FkbM family methyltransferase [Chloroflexota bacterium]